MARNLNEAESRDQIRRRVDALRPDAAPAWGSLTAPRMLGHLIESLRMATGDLRPKPAGPWVVQHWPVKHLILYGPWPKGAPTAPELLARTPAADLEQDRAEFRRWLDRYADARGRSWPVHPFFGALDEDQWGYLCYKHFDHHLRQFGV